MGDHKKSPGHLALTLKDAINLTGKNAALFTTEMKKKTTSNPYMFKRFPKSPGNTPINSLEEAQVPPLPEKNPTPAAWPNLGHTS